MVHEALQVAQQLGQEGVSAEVIDVATLRPLDMDTILASVAKTGRCVIVTEAPRACSFASEIAANLAEHGLLSLFAPVMRVSSYDVVVPLSRLEGRYMPDAPRILDAVRKCLSFG
jgi:pyruvate dehydrogenase E1 component beta subunit